jgi:hypothetical protein
MIIREGNYTKFLSFGNEHVLAFIAKNEDDNFFKVLNMVREQNKNYNGFQVCEEKEERNNFKNVFFIFYNIYGQPKKAKLLQFDFDNNKVITETGRSYKMTECNEYVYKIQKTQIKAIDGIKGFYKHIIEAMHVDSAFNSHTYNIIEKLETV